MMKESTQWILKHSESESVYTSESDFGWSQKVFLDHPQVKIFTMLMWMV